MDDHGFAAYYVRAENEHGFVPDAGDGAWTASQLATAAGNVYSFVEDAAGEVYLSTGAILRVD